VYRHPVANANGDVVRTTSGQRLPGQRLTADVAEDANPTVRQRELALRLRELRLALGLTVEQVGAELLCSATKISRIETAARRASLRDIRDLCRVYGVADPGPLMELGRRAREPGWWSRFDDLSLDPFIGLEQEAAAITSYTMYWVPGLLQTAEYAAAIVRGIVRKIDSRVLADRVEARLLRQKRLESAHPPRYRALVDEAVFHRQVGGPQVMKAQLDKILTWGAMDRGSIQVIAFAAGAHASSDAAFDLFEFGENTRQSPVVFVETFMGGYYYERPVEIERYREAIEYLREEALSRQDSLALIASIRDQLSAVSG
jgi:transcriptional regulator with XRE-family HTH domain